ncbi:MAG: ribosomal RNA small subunit methyltransferase A [Anaerolineales bacterium]|nr:ribosomal RNA small subunit methyltransferase A [Anaerolineales bacterium]
MSGLSLPPLNLAAILKQYRLRPSKGLGQNFLQDNHALQEIVAVADLGLNDCVLEIGPGLGSLTRYLAIAARTVTAVELDQDLFPALQAVLAPYSNVHLVHGDILTLPPAELVDASDYLVVANIPYYITSALLRHLLEAHPRPRRMVLTVQREVAERICAGPGRMSLLALSVQVYGQAEVAAHIPAGAFYPPPNVDSAVVRIEVRSSPVIPTGELGTFFRLARAGFSQKRKTLRNALAGGLAIEPALAEQKLGAAGIDPQRRAETLSLEEWKRLVENE